MPDVKEKSIKLIIAVIIGIGSLGFLMWLIALGRIPQEASNYLLCIIAAIVVGTLYGVIGGAIKAEVERKKGNTNYRASARGGIAAFFVTLVILLGAFKANLIEPAKIISGAISDGTKGS